MTEPSPGPQPTQPLCIAHVTSERRRFSGGEVQVFLLMEGLRHLGHRCLLFGPAGSPCAEEAERRAFAYTAVPLRHGADVASVAMLARGFRNHGVQVVHLHTSRATWLGGLAAWIARLPAVSTRRMDRPVAHGWRTRLIYRHLMQRVLPISPAVAAGLTAAGVPPERMQLIYESVDPERLHTRAGRAATRAALGASESACVLLALCVLIRRKGLDVLLDALALLRAGGLRPPLWIAGAGPARADLVAQAQRLGLGEVTFLGRRDDVGDLLAACDVFVMPSRREGLGVAALEGMAAGRPVICSAVGGLAHSVVHERSGILVPPEDPPALAEAVARLVRDPALRLRLGAQGPMRIAEGFLPTQMVAANEDVYRTVLGERAHREVRQCARA